MCDLFIWSYNQEKKDKKEKEKAKEHHCLIPIEEFETDDLKDTYRYDLASVYYIPVYLAKSGYGVVEIED